MPPALPGDRAGFTVIEQLIALVVLAVGLLTLARGVVALQQQARRAALQLNASGAAASSVERMTAAACTAAAGSDSVGAVSVRWERGGGSPAAPLSARAEAGVIGPVVAESLASARACRPGGRP